MSHKSRSAVKKNRIMKLYFVNDMIGQWYGHVTLERQSLLCLLIYTDFYGVLTSKYFM